ncbi:MAG TPA: hypothetical protein VLM85_08230 [Polyangiaceae bacterium]|nr:hypothetical protein [Polyangiaceae bacterium]
MQRTLARLLTLSAVGLVVACATNVTPTDPFADYTTRAQGTIVLRASHAPNDSTIAPSVAVSFIPDSTALSRCGTTTSGTCEITQAPDCSSLKCGMGETCGFDDSCQASCVKACTKSCGADQNCAFESDGTMACHAIESFDVGPIAFSGTEMPIALYPPYAWKTADTGSPFAPNAALRVTAEGPTGAGFVGFDTSFTATTLLEANPPLDQLALSDVFGSDDLHLGWTPGNDRIFIEATGAGGSARCWAADPAGGYDLSRDVLSAVMGDTNAVQLSIERYRLDRHKDMKTTGSLDGQNVQPVAWLDLVTSSTESISLEACTSTQTSCGSKCVDTSSDPNNCGSCGNSCSGGACVSGSCQSSSSGSCSSCQASADVGSCSSEYSSCTGTCKSLLTCVESCGSDLTCQQTCQSTYPSGASAFSSYWSCICGTACSTECGPACGN